MEYTHPVVTKEQLNQALLNNEIVREVGLVHKAINRLYEQIAKAGHEPHRVGTIRVRKIRTESGWAYSASAPIRTLIIATYHQFEGELE